MREVLKRIGVGLVLGAALVGCGDDEEPAPVIRTIRVVEHADTDATTDNAPAGDSVGDILTFANPVFDEGNTRQVGTNQGYCIRVVVGQAYECFWTTFLEEGQLTVEGPFYDAKGSTLAITGGTKAFNGARGQMQLEFRNPQGTEFDFIYQVLLDP
ncbi:allene oxide cyclase family protein [Hyalangium gracile]|uniref:allene oxide cyclase family protein n=1 Tax=Hyalangium gracile TaxID=394092 RepID=UPI001CCBCCF4|nr:allene oxide cyclase family protein [Hyalangium gracile]